MTSLYAPCTITLGNTREATRFRGGYCAGRSSMPDVRAVRDTPRSDARAHDVLGLEARGLDALGLDALGLEGSSCVGSGAGEAARAWARAAPRRARSAASCEAVA